MQASLTDLMQLPVAVVMHVCWEGAKLQCWVAAAAGGDPLGFSAGASGLAF